MSEEAINSRPKRVARDRPERGENLRQGNRQAQARGLGPHRRDDTIKNAGRISEFTATPHDDAVLEKVFKHWRASSAETDSIELTKVWTRFITDFQRPLTDALDAGDRPTAKAMLSQFWKEPFTQGYAQGRSGFDKLSAKMNAGNMRMAEAWGSKIINVAEAVGAINSQGVERRRQSVIPDTRTLIKNIEKITGVPFGLRELNAGLFGLEIDGISMHRKEIEGYVLAYQVSQLWDEPYVCEVGTGAGHTSYFLSKFGAKRVYMFDLPSVAVVAIWFLGRLEGPDAVCVYGEEPTEATKYVVRPHFTFGDENKEKFSFNVLVNKNSFPEMGEEVAAHYIKKSTVYDCKYVYSSNYERGEDVGKHIALVWKAAERAGWRRLSRTPNWVKVGNVEEIFLPPSGG